MEVNQWLTHSILQERSVGYEKSLQERSKIIRQTEMENMATGRKKQRGTCYEHELRHRSHDVYQDLNSFRAALNVLQAQVDQLDRLKEDHYREIIEHEEEVWTTVLGKVFINHSCDTFIPTAHPYALGRSPSSFILGRL